MSISLVDRLLGGDPEAPKEYRSLVADQELDPSFTDRILSKDNIAKLNEAKSLGINPDSILLLCHYCAYAKWTKNPLLTAAEAKDAVRELRKMKRFLRWLLPRTLFPMLEPQRRDNTASPLAFASPTAPRFSQIGKLPLLGPVSMRKLWEVAGTDQDNGLLEDLADAIEDNIPSIKIIFPAHRQSHPGKQIFAVGWDNLTRKTVQRPCHGLGAWFCAVTFGLSPDHFDATAFRMWVKRSRS